MDDKWLRRADEAFNKAISYADTNYRNQWEDNLRLFQNKHPKGSKYYSESYKYRSKMFRPKTRSVVRNNEAATAAAFFTSHDATDVRAMDQRNPLQVASAEVRKALLNYRLNHTTPGEPNWWFLTCIGAMQDAQVQGIVCSKQEWIIEKEEVKEPLIDENGEQYLDEEGKPATQKVTRLTKNEPHVRLLPVENVLFDPAASWANPVCTSPYLIILEPMYVIDVKEKIENGDWLLVTDKQLAAAREHRIDTTRQTRMADREDNTKDNGEELKDFDIVWVHENIISEGGKDIHFYTLACEAKLTEPKPLKEVYWHGKRPVVIGTSVIETHKTMPASYVELGAGLQKEANEIANQRFDNVSLVLNKKYFVRRGKQVDLKALVRNVPGGAVLMNDPEKDAIPIDFNDVTGSSYAEQDRLNLDFDDLLGSFSGGSVQSNRKLNETVGGMQMLKAGSNMMTQYLLQIFSVTWAKPVLEQLDMLEQHYESDAQLLGNIANELDLAEKYGVEQIDEQFLMQPAEIIVNVANSATDPMIRLEQLLYAVTKYAEFRANAPPEMDSNEIAKEIFGFLGYPNNERFFVGDGKYPPELVAEVENLNQMVQQLQQALDDQAAKAQIEADAKLQDRQLQEEGNTTRTEMDNITDLAIASMHRASNAE